MVFGEPAQVSERLIGHPAIRKVTFTGSTAVGAEIAGLAARRVIRTSLELGGHAPVLVFEDADLDLVLRTAGAAKFRNAGQVCISPTRFVVHESLHDDLAARLAKHAAGLVVGPGTDPDTTMGPLVHDRRVAAIQSLVDDAVARGGQLLAGGTAGEPRGSYYRPTVIAAAAPDSRAMHEEPFGPLALLTPFGSDDEAFDIANSTEYGLAAYAFTDSLRTARRVAAEVQAGMIAINHAQLVGPETPFGGLKQSGYGSDGGAEALDDYLNVKLVSQT
ncbi:MAG TPA: aldehyde dehydrogenase family protein [Nocardioidaceae bacterium]|nr:aldehyde dehydrogenase family protein [Nocardioidaceae bacterium]